MISVVMPAHNERGFLESAVKAVVAGVRDRGLDFEVVIAENGSQDGTIEEARNLASTYPEVSLITSTVADYGTALRRGFEASRGEVVVNFDVDLVDVGFLVQAIELMEETDVAIVIGSKRSPGAEDRRSFSRRMVTAVFAALLKYGFGLHASDTHGLKALRRSVLVDVVESCQFGAEIFDTELILRAERAGLRVEEVPVSVREIREPRTPITRRIPRALMGLVRLRWALR